MPAGTNTTINTAIDSLLDLFDAVAAENSPYGPADEQETILVADVAPQSYTSRYILTVKGFSNWTQVWFTVGQSFDRLESYDLDCEIHCVQGDSERDSRRARRTEAFALLDLIKEKFYEELRIGSVLGLPAAADIAIVAGEATQGQADGSNGWGIDLDFTVHVENVILTD